jgi:hypothetical protein
MTETADFTAQWRAAMALQIEGAIRPWLNANTPTAPAAPVRIKLQSGVVYAVHPRFAGDRQLPAEWLQYDMPPARKRQRRAAGSVVNVRKG